MLSHMMRPRGALDLLWGCWLALGACAASAPPQPREFAPAEASSLPSVPSSTPPTSPAAPLSAPAPVATGCTSDDQCQIVDDMCGGCRCVALAASDVAAKCPTAPVQCFVAPCLGRHAVCRLGECRAVRTSSADR